MKFLGLFLLLSFVLAEVFSANFVLAVSPTVVINEIAWMGAETSYNDEWIELHNPNSLSIDLAGWILKAADGTPEITLTGVIPAHGFYLLERTDDNTVPEVLADQIYAGALSNDGENLGLHDNSGNLIDSVDCASQWLAGDNQTKQTMERSSSDNWQNSEKPGGTPKTKNSEGAELSPESELRETGEPAAINEQGSEESSASFIVLLIAVIVAVFSGAIILILKTKFPAKRSKEDKIEVK
jgi:hypothetical protein